MTGSQKLIRRAAFYYREGQGESRHEGTAIIPTPVDSVPVSLRALVAPRSRGGSQVALRAA